LRSSTLKTHRPEKIQKGHRSLEDQMLKYKKASEWIDKAKENFSEI
jgi:hypothetical protein